VKVRLTGAALIAFVAIVAMTIAVGAPAGSRPADSPGLLPDLRTVVPLSLGIQNQQQREYLRFANGIANTGAGDWRLRPDPPPRDNTTTDNRSPGDPRRERKRRPVANCGNLRLPSGAQPLAHRRGCSVRGTCGLPERPRARERPGNRSVDQDHVLPRRPVHPSRGSHPAGSISITSRSRARNSTSRVPSRAATTSSRPRTTRARTSRRTTRTTQRGSRSS
jgi:hypothetical protein